MDPGSDESDPRLARRLARDSQKEETEKDQKTLDEDSALNPTLPPKDQAGSELTTAGTSYPVASATSAASTAAFQGNMPEFVQALQQMGLSQAEIISALCELQLKREAAARSPPSRPIMLTDPTVHPVQQPQQEISTSNAGSAALHSPSGSANATPALQSFTTSAIPSPSTSTAVVRPALQPLQPAQQPTQAMATVIFQSKPPVLRSCSIAARGNFREAYRQYLVQNKLEAARHRVAPSPVPVVAAIDMHVLDSICRNFLDYAHQGEPSAVDMQHVEDFVMGTGHYARPLPLRSGFDSAFRHLKMPLKGDSYVRVDTLLRKKREIVRKYRCGSIKEKGMVRHLPSRCCAAPVS